MVSKKSGVKTLADAKGKVVAFGSTGRRSVTLSRPGDVQPHRRHAVQDDRRLQGNLRHRHRARARRGRRRRAELGLGDQRARPRSANGDIIPVFAMADGRMKALPDVPSMTQFGREDAEKTFLGSTRRAAASAARWCFRRGCRPIASRRCTGLREDHPRSGIHRRGQAAADRARHDVGPGPAGLCREEDEDAGGERVEAAGEGLQRIAGDAVRRCALAISTRHCLSPSS